jgi:hypothetical protein
MGDARIWLTLTDPYYYADSFTPTGVAMKMVFPLAAGCLIAFWPFRAASQLQPVHPATQPRLFVISPARSGSSFNAPPQAPVTQPVDSIVELSLEDPVKSQSKSYFDFDKGKTFSYGDSSPEDLDASRRWLRDSGADLMCESRAPADGFVAYDMALVETDKKLEDLKDYFALSKQLQAVEAQPFNAVDVGLVLPRTYLFRTREGEIGGFEVSSIDEKSHGLQIRYKLIHQPIPEQPVATQRRGGVLNMGMLIAQHKAQLKELQRTYLENHPVVIREKRQIQYLEDIEKVNQEMQKGMDAALFAMKRQRLSVKFNLDTAKDRLKDESPTVKSLQRSLDKLDELIQSREAKLAAATQPSAAPTTKPVIFVQ